MTAGKNIGVNARLLLADRLEGIGWYAVQILKRIVAEHPEHQFFFFFDRAFDESMIFGPNVRPIVVGPQARHPLLYLTWFDAQLPRLLRKHKIDVFFSPEGFTTLRSKVPTVITIHDLAYLHFPKFIDRTHRLFYKKYQPRYAQHAHSIIAVSEYTKQDIEKQYGITADKIKVVYNAANPAYETISEEKAEEIRVKIADGREYFLFVGALHPRKNIINLLKAFVLFKRKQKSKMKLVMVGRMAWDTKEIEEAKERMPFREDVVWLDYQPVAQLRDIMAAAYTLVYPSLFEGFGIPIVEAMACGVPSIVGDNSSMPEVGGTAVIAVDATEPKAIAAAMERIYIDERLRLQLSRNCTVELQRFDWDKSAQEVWNVIEELV